MNFLMHRLPNGHTILDELASLVLALLVIAVIYVVNHDFKRLTRATDTTASGLKDDPIELTTLRGFEAVPNHWYHFNGVTFKLIGNEWYDTDGRMVEPSPDSDNWL